MVTHLPGFFPFCEVHEFLFFYHLYSTTGKKPLQSLFFISSERLENHTVSIILFHSNLSADARQG